VTTLAVTATETDLVVDNDEIVRVDVGGSEDPGYTVLLAPNGAVALALLEKGI
jgi:hypothetical protein